MSTNIRTKIRCQNCKKLLAISTDTFSAVEIKCPRCGTTNNFDNLIERQLIITNKEGAILSINKKTEEITGYTLNEVIGKKPSIWGNEMSESFYKKMWKDLQNKKTISVQLKNRAKNGKFYHVTLKIQPMLDKNKEIKFLLGEEQLIK